MCKEFAVTEKTPLGVATLTMYHTTAKVFQH